MSRKMNNFEKASLKEFTETLKNSFKKVARSKNSSYIKVQKFKN